jgi:hypothetical protein
MRSFNQFQGYSRIMKNTLEKIELNPREKSNLSKSSLIADMLWIVSAIGLLSLYILAESSLLKKLIFHEDGVLEFLQAAFFFMAAFIFFLKAFKKGINNKLVLFWYFLFAALLLVVGGEEISWGQRIFGIVTPEQLNAVNVQHEFNFHNINGVHQNIRLLGAFFVTAIFYFVPLSNRYLQGFHRLYKRWQLPIFPLSGILVVTISILLMIVPRLFIHQAVYEIDEIGEFYLSLSWLIYAVESYRNGVVA